MFIWLQFLVCTGIILVSGTYLSKYGDVIAEKTRLGRTWVSVALMASVTSLPELVTGISSVAMFDLPNIAAGDVLGSCMFNILILELLDCMGGSAPVSTKARGSAHNDVTRHQLLLAHPANRQVRANAVLNMPNHHKSFFQVTTLQNRKSVQMNIVIERTVGAQRGQLLAQAKM